MRQHSKPAAPGQIVVFKPVALHNGGHTLQPIRLPYVTMHAKVLEERRHG